MKKTPIKIADFMEREVPALSDVVTFCSNLPISLYADSTVVKSPEVVFRGLVLSKNRFTAEDYLLNFRRPEADLGVVIGANNYRLPMAVGAVANRDLEESDEGLIKLPAPGNERSPLGPVIRSRRSVRKYSGKAVRLGELSTLLAHSAGITGHMHVTDAAETATLGSEQRIDLRAAMSGGGLYPIDLGLLAINIDGVAAGAYQYLPKQHALKPMKRVGKAPDLQRLAQFNEIEVEKAAFLVCYVYNVFENSRKYGEAGLGFAFIETGAIAAHIHLLATALGLGACDVGSFLKRRFERLFEADGVSRHVIHLTVVGK